MKISSLKIHAFGKLKDLTLSLSDGINLVTGANESGKSSVARFIRFMLYGYTSSRSGSLAENDKRRFTPWDDVTSGGEMTVLTEKDRLTLRREQASRASFSMTDQNGSPVFRGEVPGEVLLGVSAETFDKTAFISSGDVFFEDSNSLSAAIKNMVFAADSTIDSDAALKKLDALRRSILGKTERSGRLFEARNEFAELNRRQTELVAIHRDLLSAASSLERVRTKLAENSRSLEVLEKEHANLEAFSAKGLCEKLLAAEQKEAESRKLFEQSRMELTFEGFLPDRAYLTALNDALVALERADLACEAAKVEHTAAEQALAAIYGDTRKRKFHKQLESTGKTANQIKEDIAVLQKKRKSFQMTAMILTLLIITLPAAIFFWLRARSLSKQLLKLATAFDCTDIGELLKMLDGHAAASQEALSAEERVKKAEKVTEAAQANRAGCAAALCSELDKTGLGVTYSDTSALAEETKAHIRSLDGSLSRLEALEQTHIKHLSLLEGISDSIADRAALFALANTYDASIPLRPADKVLREIDFYRRANQGLEVQERDFEKKAAVIAGNMEKPDELAAKINVLATEIDTLEKKKAALDMAFDAIDSAHEKMRGDVSPLLTRRASELFALMTDGKYQGLYVDSSLKLAFLEKDGAEYREADYLSSGALDAAYLCLRITLAEYLYTEPPVLVFDDAFLHFDDSRLQKVLDLLVMLSEHYQILILSCSDREKSLLDSRKINHICL